MLKGVNRQVVEINQPESKYFERIFYIVKPEFSDMSKSKLLGEANKYNCDKDTPPVNKKKAKAVVYTLAALLLISVSVTVTLIVLK